MGNVYVTGHVNPDIDCTVSSYAYAYLKNIIDPDNRYISICCGALNDQIRTVFKKANIVAPALYKRLMVSVGDITKTECVFLPSTEPILNALKILRTQNISFIPVLDNGSFMGVVSINEIASWYISEHENPVYHFRTENIMSILSGELLHGDASMEFEGNILAGAMPFKTYCQWMKYYSQKAVLVVGNRRKILEYAINQECPAIIITGLCSGEKLNIDFSNYKGIVYSSKYDTAESIRLLRMSVPISMIANKDHPRIQINTDFEDAKNILLSSEYRGLPVFSDNVFIGIVTRRCFIEKPVKKVILIDHNEIHQSIPGARNSQVMEIIDHHRLGAEKTNEPIYISVKPVGSTSTIIYEHFLMYKQSIPKEIAIILQSGIIADTINLKSPTTTEVDITALQDLSRISGINNDDYAVEMFSQLKKLKERDPEEIITADFKTYNQFSMNLGIGQVEVISLSEVEVMREIFHNTLNRISTTRNLHWTLLLITDVIDQRSILISSYFPKASSLLIYQQIAPHVFDLPKVLSRKKQLLPEVLRIAEELEILHK